MKSPAASPPAADLTPPSAPTVPDRPRTALLAPPPSTPPTLWGRVVRWGLLIAVVAAGYHSQERWLPWVKEKIAARNAPPPKPPVRAIPVITAKVLQRDFDLYLNGLGTVTALNTVTVRSRVEGELVEVMFDEGQIVKKGDLLARIDPRPFERQRDQAKGAVARDEAALNLARLNLKRQEDLLKSNATTQAQYDLQVATVAQADAALKTNEAILENAELQLTYCSILAPINGRVGLRLVDQGNMVRANDPTGIAVITEIQPIAVVFTIPQDEIPRVQRRAQEGQELLVDAFDRDFKTKLATGKLTAFDNQVDSTTGTLRLKAEFRNTDRALFPNQFVNARLLVETISNALVIPSAAVQRGIEGTFVYVAREDDTVEKRPVVLGPSQGNESSVRTGLSVNELVVTDGVDKLAPNAKISFRDKPKVVDARGEKPSPAAAKPAAKKEASTSPAPPVPGKAKA